MMASPCFILASQSQIRAQILKNAGLSFDIEPAYVDEAAVKETVLATHKPFILADALAELKALKVSQKHPFALILGCDQVLICEGRVLDKPKDLEEARAHLDFLSAKTHKLISAAVLVQQGQALWRGENEVILKMRDLSAAFIDDYIKKEEDQLLSSVGAYRLEGLGAQLFETIEGDYFSVLGLPLLPLLKQLRQLGVLTS